MVNAQLQLMRTIISLHAHLGERSVNSLGSFDASGIATYLKKKSCLVQVIKRRTVGLPEVKSSFLLDRVETCD